MTTLGLPDDEPIQNGIISKTIESAQSKIEGFNFDIRKHVLDYDDVMNKQREVVYRKRRAVLEQQDFKNETLPLLSEELDHIISFHTAVEEGEWNMAEIVNEANAMYSTLDEKEALKKLESIRDDRSKDEVEKTHDKTGWYVSDVEQAIYIDIDEVRADMNIDRYIPSIIRGIDSASIANIKTSLF